MIFKIIIITPKTIFTYMSRNQNQKPCPYCNGKGSCLAMGEELCPRCAGTGRDTKSDCWSEPCLQCNGKGKVTYCRQMPCVSCRGTGTAMY